MDTDQHIISWNVHSLIVPSRRWPGEGMLGVTIRFDSFFDAEEHILHILEVEPNSPAEIAGLQPMHDFLLGTAEKVYLFCSFSCFKERS